MQNPYGTISENWSLAQWRATAINSPSLYRKAIIQVLDVAPRLIPCAEARAQDAILIEGINCPSCAEEFETFQAMAVHMFKMHGIKCAARNHLDTTHCPHCLLELWTRQRALDHLRRSAACCAAVLSLPRLGEELITELDDASRETTRNNVRLGRHRNWAEVPSIILSGPLHHPHHG